MLKENRAPEKPNVEKRGLSQNQHFERTKQPPEIWKNATDAIENTNNPPSAAAALRMVTCCFYLPTA